MPLNLSPSISLSHLRCRESLGKPRLPLFLLLLGALSLSGFPSPNFSQWAKPITLREKDIPLPIFVLPKLDHLSGNDFVVVFIHRKADKVHFTIEIS